MRVLLISNQAGNAEGVGNPIIYRLTDALAADERIEKVTFEPFVYSIRSLRLLRKTAKKFDIIHVHFGGLYALFIYYLLIGINVKKIITFHGTDIHAKAVKTSKSLKEKLKIILNQKASFLCIRLYDKCGFVALDLCRYVPPRLSKMMSDKAFIQKLGVDYRSFSVLDKSFAQTYLKLKPGKYVLFSNISNTSIKRQDIAEKIIEKLKGDYRLLLMRGVKPIEVPFYINACDFVLITSDEEGSPNIVREALTLNKPVFSVDVGDVADQLKGLVNSAIISRDPANAAFLIMQTMQKPYIDNTRDRQKDILDIVLINRPIVDLYCLLNSREKN